MHRPHRSRSILSLAPPALLALAVLLYAVYFSVLTITRYQAYESRALDMGNLHQAIWNTAQGDWFRMTNQEEGLTSRLSMHVEPILLPIAGLYRLLPGVETLLVLQATVVALGALPIFALARRRRLGDWLALAFAVAWLLNPTIQAANWLEFHPVTLAPTFLLAAFYFLVCSAHSREGVQAARHADRDDLRHPLTSSPRHRLTAPHVGVRTGREVYWFTLFAVLAAACKEEIGLLVAMMGLYAALVQRRWRFGVITFALGAGWSLLAVLGIQAAFAGGNIHWGRYAWLGETTGAKLLTLVTRPDLVLAQLGAADAPRYFFELLLPVGFLSLLAPEVLLLALPSLAINLLAQFSPMHQVTTLIYAAPVIPFVFLSAVMGSARLLGWLAKWRAAGEHGHVGVPAAPHVGVRTGQEAGHEGAPAAPHVGVRTGQEAGHVGVPTAPHVGVRTGQEAGHVGAPAAPHVGVRTGQEAGHEGAPAAPHVGVRTGQEAGHEGAPEPHVGVRTGQGEAHPLTRSPSHPVTSSPRHLVILLLPLYVLAFALLGQRLYGYLPGSGNDLPLAVTAHHQAAQAILDQIPPDAAVSAQDRLNPHVAGRRTVYIFPRVDDADYVLLDVTGSAWPQHPNDLQRAVEGLREDGFGVAAAADGYLLLGRGIAEQTIDEAFYTAWQAPDQPLPGSVNVGAQFGDGLRLEAYRVRSDRYGELVVDLIWTVLQPMTQDLRFYVGLSDQQGNVLHDNLFYQPVSVLWYPTSLWPANQRVLVSTLPWAVETDPLVLAVGVYAGEEGWTDGNRLPVTASAGLPVLEEGTLLRLGGFTRGADGDWAALPALPPAVAGLPTHPLAASFGEALHLLAASLPAEGKAGAPLSLALAWQRDGGAPPNLVRFVHLLDGAGEKVAQVDGQVTDAFGPLPVGGWPSGAPVQDLVTLSLPAELPPGDYTVVAGWYDWQTGERLPAAGESARADGAVTVGPIRIVQP